MYEEYIKHIDPKEGYYIEYFESQFPDIMDRAREILKHRTQKEIFAAGKILDQILLVDSEESQLHKLEHLFDDVDENGDIILPPSSPARELAYYIEKTGIENDPKFPSASIEEYFSVLTLAIVGEAYQEQEAIKKTDYQVDKKCWFAMGHYAVEAMEAVAYGESLIMARRAEAAVVTREQEKRSSIAKQAGEAKYDKTRALLKSLHKFHLDNGYTKYSQAVHDFLSQTPEADYRHLAPTNRERTLREGLSRIIKGKLVI